MAGEKIEHHLDQYIRENNLYPLVQVPRIRELMDGERFTRSVDIPPSSTGALFPMFTSISLSYTLVKNTLLDGRIVVRLILNYKYEHPSASNGYSVFMDFSEDGIIYDLKGYIKPWK